jgi:nitroimidazol reductase NimA-like FMN-containing flavoprotein (pyridoxamine 5'-phosphate oxidase superfamily)
MSKVYYEDLSPFRLSEEECDALLRTQSECTFCWTTKDGAPMGVIMGYVWRDGRLWTTATSQRARITAIRRDPRCAVVVTSRGVDQPPARTVTLKGRCVIHDDPKTKAWFYPALAETIVTEPGPTRDAFIEHLDSPLRVVIEVIPEKSISCDAMRMMEESFAALGVT